MSITKDNKTHTWTVQFYYTDWTGEKKHKKKRGFATKKEGQEWERKFLNKAHADMNMKVSDFIDIYFEDKKSELKERSIRNKKYMIKAHIVPYFGNKAMNSITPADLIQWQNTMREKGYSQTYLRMIQNQMTALFTHACNIYNLVSNPCKKVKKMGKSDADRLDFWTKEEYDKFIATIEKDSRYYVIFEILFWTGCRIGELLALTLQDIDFKSNQINIRKTYYRINRKDVITTPKTEQSIRTIDIPTFLTEEIKNYADKFYKLPENERLLPIVAEAIQHKLKRHCVKAGVKRIRLHSLRHSHTAYLIYQGVQPLIIKERLGHRDIKITLNTYGHLYPSQQKAVAELLNQKKTNEKCPS